MKKIFYIAFALILALGGVSCTELLDQNRNDAGQRIPDDATLTIGFGVPMEIQTKAADMAHAPKIESIHVFIFDEEGTLLQVRKAEVGESVSVNYDGESNPTTGQLSYWEITNVMMSAEKRVLHFVANLPEDLVPTSGSETSIFQTLAVSAPTAAYWQKVELKMIEPYTYAGGGVYDYIDDSGIFHEGAAVIGTVSGSSYKDSNNQTVNVGDYIDRNSCKIINGTGYYFYPTSEFVEASQLKKLKQLPLVRNFAQIHFVNSWDQFIVKKVALVNTPNKGLVAPFSSGSFVDEYMTGLKPNRTNITTYSPILPSGGINTNGPDTEGFVFTNVDVTTQSADLFMYERGIPKTDATCILVGGELNGATVYSTDDQGNKWTWFKIEITNSRDGSYFPLYRDFVYPVEIESISAAAVQNATAQAAFIAAPVGDLSNSPETETMTEISDGKGLVLRVSYVDLTDLSGNKNVPLLYTFYYKPAGAANATYFHNTSTGDEERVTFSRVKNTTLDYATGDVIKQGIIDDDHNRDYLSMIPDNRYTWYLAEVPLNAKGNYPLQSVIKAEGKVTVDDGVPYAASLTRKVTYTVVGQQKLGLKTSWVEGKPQLTISLPNTLTYSTFPLTLKIEAEDGNLNPTPDSPLPVEDGVSLFDSGRRSFYFLKTIDYTEYSTHALSASQTKDYVCKFDITLDSGHAGTVADPITRIRVIEKIEETDNREDSWFLGGTNATVALVTGSTSTN